MKNKHLSFDERMSIQKGLTERKSFKQIGKELGKDCTTISKEVRNHIIFKNTGAVGRPFFDCAHRHKCEYRPRGSKCNQNTCSNYKKEICSKFNLVT